MNLILKKLKSGYRRLKNGIEVTLIPQNFYIYQKQSHDYHNLSYSQEGEDMILSRIFAGKDIGFYVDVGAHHPQRFSNTYYFYLRGWRGINIDAQPGSMVPFNIIRPKDINLEIPIFDRPEVLTYYEFNEPALNSFSEEVAKERDGVSGYRIICKKHLKTYTLSDVLDKYVSPEQDIDFLNVDVEGLDYNVLKSNNWEKYRPQIVLVEDLQGADLLSERMNESKISEFMYKEGYNLYAKSVNTLIFRRSG